MLADTMCRASAAVQRLPAGLGIAAGVLSLVPLMLTFRQRRDPLV